MGSGFHQRRAYALRHHSRLEVGRFDHRHMSGLFHSKAIEHRQLIRIGRIADRYGEWSRTRHFEWLVVLLPYIDGVLWVAKSHRRCRERGEMAATRLLVHFAEVGF